MPGKTVLLIAGAAFVVGLAVDHLLCFWGWGLFLGAVAGRAEAEYLAGRRALQAHDTGEK